MEEMTLLQDFRSAVAPPDPDKLEAARTRVVSAARQEAVPRPGRKLRLSGRARMLTWPRLAISGAVAAGVTAAVILAMGIAAGGHAPRLGGPPHPPQVTLDVLLQRAAAVARAQPVPRAGQYVYSDAVTYNPTFSHQGKVVSGHITVQLQEWQPVSGSRPSTYRATPCVIDGDTANVLPGPCMFTGSASQQTPGGSSYGALEAIPTAPGALDEYLAEHGALVQRYGHYAALWYSIVVILQDNPVVPPKLSAALFEAARKIPGVVLLGSIVSPAGAHGVAVAKATPWTGLRAELIFDPRTYRFVGSQDVTVRATDGLAADSVWDATALVRTTVVNGAPGNCQPTRAGTACGSSSSSSGSSASSGSRP